MKSHSLLVTVILIFTVSLQAYAGETLSIDEIKVLISGKTIHGKHEKKGFNFRAYFNADGTMVRKWKSDNLQPGKYHFKDNLHCINVGGGDKCGTIVDNGDGTYNRLKNGNPNKHFITWTKIVDGKDL